MWVCNYFFLTIPLINSQRKKTRTRKKRTERKTREARERENQRHSHTDKEEQTGRTTETGKQNTKENREETRVTSKHRQNKKRRTNNTDTRRRTGDRTSQVKLSALFRRTKRPRRAVTEEKAFAFIIEVSSDQPETIALTSSSSPTVTRKVPAALPLQYN